MLGSSQIAAQWGFGIDGVRRRCVLQFTQLSPFGETGAIMNSLSRRDVLAVAASTALCGPHALRAVAGDEAERPTLPLPRQVVWQDCEVGAIFHFDMPPY